MDESVKRLRRDEAVIHSVEVKFLEDAYQVVKEACVSEDWVTFDQFFDIFDDFNRRLTRIDPYWRQTDCWVLMWIAKLVLTRTKKHGKIVLDDWVVKGLKKILPDLETIPCRRRDKFTIPEDLTKLKTRIRESEWFKTLLQQPLESRLID